MWNPDQLPKKVSKLVTRCHAVIVGSQAELCARGLDPSLLKDWDLFVPYHYWSDAVRLIPMTSVPNGRRGWRFVRDGVGFDVWPDELSRYLSEATSDDRIRAKPNQSAYAVDLNAKLVFQALRIRI